MIRYVWYGTPVVHTEGRGQGAAAGVRKDVCVYASHAGARPVIKNVGYKKLGGGRTGAGCGLGGWVGGALHTALG